MKSSIDKYLFSEEIKSDIISDCTKEGSKLNTVLKEIIKNELCNLAKSDNKKDNSKYKESEYIINSLQAILNQVKDFDDMKYYQIIDDKKKVLFFQNNIKAIIDNYNN